MKKATLFILFTFMLIVKSRAQEIDFIYGDWNKAIAMAKLQHKAILVDFYTDWCYWCKQMDKTAYIDPKIIDYVNANFIPVKINAEKDFGIELAMKYRVNGYPCYGYFNEDAKLVSKSVGYEEVDAYLKTLKEKISLVKKGKYCKGISDKVELNYPDFYRKAFAGSTKRRMPVPDTVSAFLKHQSSLTSEIAFSVIYTFDTDSAVNKYFLDNIKTYEELYGAEDAENKAFKIIYYKFNGALQAKNKAKMEQAIDLVDKYITENKEETKVGFRVEFYKQTEDWKNFTATIDEAIARNFAQDDQVNEYSWDVYEKVDDKFTIAKAIDWMSKVVANSPEYAYMDTYASLLYKAGKYDEAEKYAQKAIDTGNKTNEKVAPTEELLLKIRTAKGEKP